MYSTNRYRAQGLQQQRPANDMSIAATFHSHEIRDPREMAKAIVKEEERECPPWDEPPATLKSANGLGLNRTKSLFSMVSCNLSLSASDCNSSIADSSACSDEEGQESSHGTRLPLLDVGFVPALRCLTGESILAPDFHSSELRKAMELHLRKARLQRERSRSTRHHNCAASIASSMGVPYTSLRQERPFLFDEHTFPLHTILADTLEVKDLRQVHTIDESVLLTPLLSPEKRHTFHAAYDGFVTSFCIPLLHSMAISKQVLQHSATERVLYRYQAFPTIQISRPGESAVSSPTCDSIEGHSVGCLTFYIPLTPSGGTNAMFIESHPGKEDWHPLQAKSVGLGYLIDGARCLHFDLENTTSYSRVSLMFRIIIHREQVQDGSLCPVELLRDKFSKSGGTYYDEAVIDARRTYAVVKAHDGLLPPDTRVGFPFAG